LSLAAIEVSCGLGSGFKLLQVGFDHLFLTGICTWCLLAIDLSCCASKFALPASAGERITWCISICGLWLLHGLACNSDFHLLYSFWRCIPLRFGGEADG
jgi:hypothetical protein